MGNEWTVKKIGDLGRIVTGKTPSTRVSKYFGGVYPFITIPDLDGRREILESERTLSSLGAEHLHSCMLPPGAVMMSCIATIGKCGITTRPSFTNQQINSVICNEDVHPEFLYYSFARLLPSLEAAGGGGSVYTNVSKSRFSDLDILLPPLPEQHAIAHILGTLDDKIELNRRMNETLEGMARALFKSWFVDFDPVRAKIEGRDTGLPPEISDLFPDEFEDSELGEIPKGWELGKIRTIASIKKTSLHPQSKPQVIWEHYSIPAFDSGKQPVFEKGEEIKSGKFLVPPDSILLSKLNPQTQRIWRPIVKNKEMAVCSTEFLPFVPENVRWRAYVEELLKSAPVFAAILEQVTGSTGSRQRANADGICNISIIAPPEDIVELFCVNTKRIHEKIDSNIQESSCLSSLRDTLLPKLISGEIRVGEAEKFLEVVET